MNEIDATMNESDRGLVRHTPSLIPGGNAPMSNEEMIRQQLSAGERLLWSSQPRQGFRPVFDSNVGSSCFIILFLVIWTSIPAGVTITRLFDVEQKVELGPIGMATCGVLMIMVMISIDPMRRKCSFYALSDQHVIVKTGASAQSIELLPLSGIVHIELREHKDGSGTIHFPDFTTGSCRAAKTPGFVRINNARMVYNLICKAREQANLKGQEA
jgi:hypothetical protein